MRVLIASDLYAPVIGGLERHVELLATELVRGSHDVTVATPRQIGAPDAEGRDGVRIRRLPASMDRLDGRFADPARRFHPPAPDPGLVRGLRRLLAAERPDVVHAHGWILYSALAAAGRHGPPVVATLHDFSLTCARKTLLRDDGPCSGPSARRCLTCAASHYGAPKGVPIAAGLRLSGAALHRRVARFVAVSTAVADDARRALGPGARVEVVPSFLPDAAFRAPAAAAQRPPAFLPDEPFLLFVGALGPHKGLDVLLAAHRRLRWPVPLVLIGTRRADTPQLPADAVVAHDVAHAEVLAAWRRCAVAVVPSRCPEGFGLAAAEAMAAGRPVVASDLGGLRDIVEDGVSGCLVPPGDAPALATALDRLLGDGDLRTRLGEAGAARALRFTAPAAVGRIAAIYAEVAGAEPVGPSFSPPRPVRWRHGSGPGDRLPSR